MEVLQTGLLSLFYTFCSLKWTIIDSLICVPVHRHIHIEWWMLQPNRTSGTFILLDWFYEQTQAERRCSAWLVIISRCVRVKGPFCLQMSVHSPQDYLKHVWFSYVKLSKPIWTEGVTQSWALDNGRSQWAGKQIITIWWVIIELINAQQSYAWWSCPQLISISLLLSFANMLLACKEIDKVKCFLQKNNNIFLDVFHAGQIWIANWSH